MLYVKLACRNVKRSLREYGIYVCTVTITMTLLYAFFAVAFSSQMQTLVKTYANVSNVLVMVSVLVTLIIAWLIYYISNFILQKRSREFGMYLLLGMKRGQIARMFLCEQLVLGTIGFLGGCVLGIFVYELLHAMLMNIFGYGYAFQLSFSWKACGSTFLCYLSMYVWELLRENRAIKKQSIHSMLYKERENEKAVKRGTRLSAVYFVAGMVLALFGFWRCKQYLDHMINNAPSSSSSLSFTLGVLCLVISIYLFFYGVAAVAELFFYRHKHIKYKGNHMYLFAQISGRLRSNRCVLATLSLLSLLTLLFLSIAGKFYEVKELSNERYVPYDILASGTEELHMEDVEDYLQEHTISYQKAKITYYEQKLEDSLYSAIDEKNYFAENEKHSKYLSLSDYNALRALKQLAPVALPMDRYRIVCGVELQEALQSYGAQYTINIKQRHLHLETLDTEEYGQTQLYGYFIVVNDELLDGETPYLHCWMANTEQKSQVAWYNDTEDAVYEANKQSDGGGGYYSYIYYQVKGKWLEENAVGYVSICFSLFYLSFVFICISATILAVQQMSDAHRQRYGYALLHKMGMSRRMLHALLAKQLAIYFILPLVLPILYLIPITAMVNDLFQQTYADAAMYTYLGFSMLFFLIVYGCYYVMAYLNCRRNVDIS